MNADDAQMNAENRLVLRDQAGRVEIPLTRFSSAFICASSAFICVFTAFGPTLSTAAEISVKDDLGRTVEMKEPATRIVTLAPALTELVFTAGAGDRVVGVSAYSDYPPQAKKLPQ